MRNDLTDLTIVLDRSGSMSATRTDAEGGLNDLIRKQKESVGECTFSLVQFDTQYEFVHNAVDIRNVQPNFKLIQRGSTALLDALGRAIHETGLRLAATAERDRPGLVLFVVVTDGQENSSHEYTKAKIKEMIERQSDVYKWQFVYLGANQNAFAQAGAIGFKRDTTTNYGEDKTAGAWGAVSGKLGVMRTLSAAGNSAEFMWDDGETAGDQVTDGLNGPYLEGHAAAIRGDTDCPYPDGSVEERDWSHGFGDGTDDYIAYQGME